MNAHSRLGWARPHRLVPMVALILAAIAAQAQAQALDVQISTDKGNQAVYQPGDQMQVTAGVNSDAFLLVYEIDSDGFVHVLYPMQGQSGHAPAGGTVTIPDARDNRALVVENNTGQDYIVAIASRAPFQELPWYLRPYDAQAQAMGYVNQPQADEEGVTTDGRIVGDPFVAMERIRRRVLADPTDGASFATAYTTYYVHEQVAYPRYVCNDCHRPGHWAWWDGWDPYYSTCSVVTFHVNWGWVWGPSYWYGTVPYFVYTYGPACPPQWRWPGGGWASSWNGWTAWTHYWNGGLVRAKTAPPLGYRSPAAYPDWHGGAAPAPPGILVTGHNMRAPINPGAPNGATVGSYANRQGGAQRMPVGAVSPTEGGGRTVEPGRSATPGRMPASPGGDAVYLHPGNGTQRGGYTPWVQPGANRGVVRGVSRPYSTPYVTVRPGGTRGWGGRQGAPVMRNGGGGHAPSARPNNGGHFGGGGGHAGRSGR